VIKKNEMVKACTEGVGVGGGGGYKVLVGRPKVRKPLGRSRRGWEDNIKMDLKEVG
jgi:hypothetical protein